MAAYSLRIPLLLLILVTACPPPSRALLQAGATPIPPGRTAANNATREAQQQIEPPAQRTHNATPADVLRQADELLSLAQQVRTDTERATQGVVAKDLNDKLKRIEKLSRRLRDELALQ